MRLLLVIITAELTEGPVVHAVAPLVESLAARPSASAATRVMIP
jgi:hypothetical protein